MFLRLLFLLCLSLLQHTLAQCPTLSHNYPVEIVMAKGWNQNLVANNVTRPRGMVLDSSGNLLVVDVGVGVIGYKIVDGPDESGCLGEYKVVVANQDLNHGIAVSEDGKTLYASSRNNVFSWPYNPRTRTAAANSKVIITNMDNTGHITRTLFVHGDYIMVSVGSQGNLDTGATDIETGRSAVKFFSLPDAQERSTPFDYAADGRVLGWGLRNSVGLTVNPKTGGVWTVENSVDMLRRGGQEVWQDNPGEELNFHGNVDEIFSNTSYVGPNYGYPYCAAVWDVPSLPDNSGLATGDQIQLEQATVQGEKPSDEDCQDPDQFVAPRLTFQAHMAPLDCTFDYFGGNASGGGDGGLWVSFHGSWNREVPAGYKLSKVPFDPATGQPLAGPGERKNYEDVIWNADTMQCKQNRCFRPVGVVVDAKGRVWMGSDASGELFVLWTKGDRSGSDNSTVTVPDNNEEKPSGAGKTAGICATAVAMWVALVGAWLA